MRALIKRVPAPLAGVMLGCAALGNLLQSYAEWIRYLFGGISSALLLLILLKLLLYPAMVKDDLKDPVMMSVSATLPMGIMLLSVYLKPFIGNISLVIWLAAIALHLALICGFTYRFILKLNIQKVFASYYIVYVGIAVAGITAPAYAMQKLGAVTFFFGAASLVCLLLLVSYRYIKYPDIPQPARPLFCIYAAPSSLCLAAYIQSVGEKKPAVVIALAILATALYLLALAKLPVLLKLPFYPSYAAFTFPFVISAIAAKQAINYLSAAGYGSAIFPAIVTIETIIAAILVCYTLFRFTIFLSRSKKAQAVPQAVAGAPK